MGYGSELMLASSLGLFPNADSALLLDDAML